MNKMGVHQVDFAEDGQKALDQVKQNGLEYYHIIFMDNTMPVMVRNLLNTCNTGMSQFVYVEWY